MATDKHWKTVKTGKSQLGTADELCGLYCQGQKLTTAVLSSVPGYILGSGYDPKIVSEAVSKTLVSGKDVVLARSPKRELVLHRYNKDSNIMEWSLREKIVFYRDDEKRLRRFDTDKQ